MNDKNREPSRHEHERGAPLVDDCDNWCKGKYSKWSAAREGGGMTIQKYDQWGRRISGDQEATFAYWPDHLAALAEKERSVHEKYKAELITQNDQLDRYEERIAALAEKDKWIDEVKMWKRDCLDFAEKQKCPNCGWNVGFMMPFGVMLRIQEQDEQIAALKEENLNLYESSTKTIAALQQWKDESLEVESSWDCQAVGKAIGIKLGGNIRKGILPFILKQEARIKELEALLDGQKKAQKGKEG
jgi:hypothetical protein